MATRLVPALAYIVGFAAYQAIILGGAHEAASVPPCDDLLDYITGCGSTISAVVSIGLLGTVTGAPVHVNTVFAVFGLTARLTVLWEVFSLIRGR